MHRKLLLYLIIIQIRRNWISRFFSALSSLSVFRFSPVLMNNNKIYISLSYSALGQTFFLPLDRRRSEAADARSSGIRNDFRSGSNSLYYNNITLFTTADVTHTLKNLPQYDIMYIIIKSFKSRFSFLLTYRILIIFIIYFFFNL